MTHEWRKKSGLHEKLWAMGLSEKEASVILECPNRSLAMAVAEWAMLEQRRALWAGPAEAEPCDVR